MSCCGQSPSKGSIEFERRYKPENNNGCGCGNVNNDCNAPSRALEGSSVWNWEQKYGKIVVTVTQVQDEQGHTVQIVEKTPCPIVSDKKHTHGCCSVRYKIVR